MDLKVLLGFVFCVMVYADQTGDKGSESADSAPSAGDDSDMYMEPLEEDHQPSSTNLEAQANNGPWYPSFVRSYDPYDQPPSGHSRPFLFGGPQQQEGAYSQRNEPPVQQDVGYNQQPKYNGLKGYTNKGYKEEVAPLPVSDKSASLLGDGNFGVIQGGTFYAEKDGYDSESTGFDDFSSYFHNGHGRPSYFYPSNPKAGKQQQQFENFRDFADINAPPDRQYSQYVVVYTNKNGTRTTKKDNIEEGTPNSADTVSNEKETSGTYNVDVDVKRPKNILESLTLLDSADSALTDVDNNYNNPTSPTRTIMVPSYEHGDIIEISPEKKVSKSKRKLAKLVPEKKHEAKLLQKAKDMNEPLLALS